jgi:hypothetical protein
MGRFYCICGFVPDIDPHDCPFDRLVEEQRVAEERGDHARVEEIELEMDRMADHR